MPRKRIEADFQAEVVKLARLCGWRVYHTFDSRRSEPGFPDLVLVGHGKVLYRELKRDGKAKPTEAQLAWMHDLICANQDARVWTPDDWDEIIDTLNRRG